MGVRDFESNPHRSWQPRRRGGRRRNGRRLARHRRKETKRNGSGRRLSIARRKLRRRRAATPSSEGRQQKLRKCYMRSWNFSKSYTPYSHLSINYFWIVRRDFGEETRTMLWKKLWYNLVFIYLLLRSVLHIFLYFFLFIYNIYIYIYFFLFMKYIYLLNKNCFEIKNYWKKK